MVRMIWGFSSAGRAPALQAGGHRFDPGTLHHKRLTEVAKKAKTTQRKRCEVEASKRGFIEFLERGT